MQNYKMWIGGKWVEAESGKMFPIFNAATGEEVARIPIAGKADVDKAVEAARNAFPIWSKKTKRNAQKFCFRSRMLLLLMARS